MGKALAMSLVFPTWLVVPAIDSNYLRLSRQVSIRLLISTGPGMTGRARGCFKGPQQKWNLPAFFFLFPFLSLSFRKKLNHATCGPLAKLAEVLSNLEDVLWSRITKGLLDSKGVDFTNRPSEWTS